MSATLGLALATDRIRAVVVRRGAIRWAAEASRSADEPLAGTLARLLKDAPVTRWPRPAVTVAIGPAMVQTKRVPGLPTLTDSAVLTQVIREGVGRFFLRDGIPLLTSGVRLVEPGTVWAAAFEQPVITDVEAACRAARLRVRAILPTAVALERALPDGMIRWRDGEIGVELTVAHHRLVDARRLPADQGEPTSPLEVPALARLGPDGWRFADAYGAAMTPRSEPLTVAGGARATHSRRRRARIVAVVGALVVVAALLAPAALATITARRAATRLRALADARREAVAIERELAQTSAALSEMAAFDADARPATSVLAELTSALPPGSAFSMLTFDSAGGSAVILGPRAAAALTGWEQLRSLSAPELIGPVTRETGRDGKQIERVMVRFRWSAETDR